MLWIEPAPKYTNVLLSNRGTSSRVKTFHERSYDKNIDNLITLAEDAINDMLTKKFNEH
jgi:hypothetical protein